MPRNARSPRANHRPANFTCHDHLTIARCQSHQPRARRHSVLSKLFFFPKPLRPGAPKPLGVCSIWECWQPGRAQSASSSMSKGMLRLFLTLTYSCAAPFNARNVILACCTCDECSRTLCGFS